MEAEADEPASPPTAWPWRERVAIGLLVVSVLTWLAGYAWLKGPLHYDPSGCPIGGNHPSAFAFYLWEAMLLVSLGNALLLGVISADQLTISRRHALGWGAAALASIGLAVVAIATILVQPGVECG